VPIVSKNTTVGSNNKVTTIALATRNRGKIEEIRIGLAETRVEVKAVDDYPGFPEVEETGIDIDGQRGVEVGGAVRILRCPCARR